MPTGKFDLIETAEQNVLNRVREAQDWIQILRAVSYAGSTFFSNYGGDTHRAAWEKGMRMAEDALYHMLCLYQADAFMFTGIGGEKSLAWAREKFRERFGLNSPKDGRTYEVMSLLDKYLQRPGMYLCDDEIEFRRQAKEKYEATEVDDGNS